MTIIIRGFAVCDGCGTAKVSEMTEETRPRVAYSIGAMSRWMRSLGWTVAFHQYCPTCKKLPGESNNQQRLRLEEARKIAKEERINSHA